ncbi:transcriptional regulator [Clostridium baratii]
MQLLNVSDSKAYKIIQKLNKELSDKGYLTIAGQVSKKYFSERYYG